MEDTEFRPAQEPDLPAIVALLADDPLGASRESPDDLAPYRAAFERLRGDPNQLLLVATERGEVVGTLQLSFLAGLSRRGSSRALIEAVRVHRDQRGEGLGGRMVQWAVDEARRRGCALIQLTSDVTRTDARRFYERLGFVASHVGFKMPL
ncbi:GNAT family acetyltransferase [Wenjunlia vitaminophila]|uniref:GNAT family acetyltransferase n=1 Tax=Wenjunlia vitaminophila TaxID=76728 RepID=A0A0T6LY06_WENVI|nr:GNAT family N-acetyltransferase [Wenjunlia vitaminophila]KRV50913.1 GNAT family acetyltransferase [Wenjunlia vitaminophila]